MDGLIRFLQIEQGTEPVYELVNDKEKLLYDQIKQYKRFYLITEQPNHSSIFFNAEICEYGLHLYGINSYSPVNELFAKIDEIEFSETEQKSIDMLIDGDGYKVYGVKY